MPLVCLTLVGVVLVLLVTASSVITLVVLIAVVFVCRRPLPGGVNAVSSVDSGGQQGDSEHLLTSDSFVGPTHHTADDDDDELDRCSRLDFDVPRHSASSRRCLVQTDELDSERVL